MWSSILSLAVCLPIVLGAPDWRVINGTYAKRGEFPAIVSIWRRGYHNCGGSLISPDTVLTAAHCFSDVIDTYREGLQVHINAFNLWYPTAEEKIVQVVKVITHPGWDRRRINNDYQLLKLDPTAARSLTRAAFSPLPKVAGVAAVQPGTKCFVVGWGSTNPAGRPGSNRLMKGEMIVISNTDCWNRGFNVYGMHLCAKSAYVSTSACRGDSGGPFYCENGAGGYVQAGIVSFGRLPCGQRNVPTVYARISTELRWILQNK